jgi:hypothetical protein
MERNKKKRIKKIVVCVLALCLFGGLGSASGGLARREEEIISKENQAKEGLKWTEDPYYGLGCGEVAEIYKIDTEQNMIPPEVFTCEMGKVYMKEGHKLLVRNGFYYTFRMWIKDPDGIDKNFSYANGITIQTTNQRKAGAAIPGSTVYKDRYSNGGRLSYTAQLFVSGDYGSLDLTKDGYYRSLGVTLQVEADTDENATGFTYIDSFSFLFYYPQTAGTVWGFQMYKGTFDAVAGFAEYDHDPCWLTSEQTGPYKPGTEMSIQVPYGNEKFNATTLQEQFKAYDKGDRAYVNITKIKDEYTTHEKVLNQVMDIVFQAEDSKKNTSQITVHVTVVDKEKPLITPKSPQISTSYRTVISQDWVKNQFVISDNYDGAPCTVAVSGIEFDKSYKQKAPLSVTITATDAVGNSSQCTTTIQLVDDVPPVINGASQVRAQAGTALSDNDILSKFTASDEIDGDCTVTIKTNGYKGKESQIGVYTVLLNSLDSSGNVASDLITVEVDDTEGPVFYVNQTIIETFGELVVPANQLVASLVRSGILPDKTYNYSEYTKGDYAKLSRVEVGKEYEVQLSAYSEDGSVETAELTIKASPEQVNSGEENESFWDRLSLFLAKLWENILAYFAD